MKLPREVHDSIVCESATTSIRPGRSRRPMRSLNATINENVSQILSAVKDRKVTIVGSGQRNSACWFEPDTVVCVNGSVANLARSEPQPLFSLVELNGLVSAHPKFTQTRQNIMSPKTGPIIVYPGNPVMQVETEKFIEKPPAVLASVDFRYVRKVVDRAVNLRLFFRSWDTVLSAGLVATALVYAHNAQHVHLCGFSMHTSRHGYKDPHNELHSEQFREHGRPDAVALGLLSLRSSNISSCAPSLQHLFYSFAPDSPKRTAFENKPSTIGVLRNQLQDWRQAISAVD